MYSTVQYKRLQEKYSLFLSDFNEILIFSADFRKMRKYKIPLQSVQWVPELFQADGRKTDRQTDRHDEANGRSSQFFERF